MLPKNFRTTPMEMKVEIIDFSQVNTKDQQLSAENADKLYLEFIDILLENCVFNLADSLLQYVTNHTTERYLLTLSKIRSYQMRYLEAIEPLDKLLSQQPNHQQAWVMRGHAYYLNGNLFDSEESYIKALRIKPAPKDPVL
jgi:Tfp pilus assembly protein PilF